MELIFVVAIILLAAIVIVAVGEDNKKDALAKSNAEDTKCGCGNTKNIDGNCDGSHLNVQTPDSGSLAVDNNTPTWSK